MWLTLLALRNRIGILMLSLAMVVLGATSLDRLPVDLFPNISVPVVFVGVIYKGAPPVDIEKSVVYPIEKAVSSASNVEHVESFAKHGIGAVQIWFNWGADINVGQMEVMQRITQILNNLPPGVLQPFVVKFDVSNIPVAFVTVSSNNLDERALYEDVTDYLLRPVLHAFKGRTRKLLLIGFHRRMASSNAPRNASPYPSQAYTPTPGHTPARRGCP